MRHWLLSAIFALLLPEIAAGQPAAPRVVSEGNGIVLERDGSKKELTRSPQDVEPVLSPDGRLVYYTRRAAGPRDEQFCGPKADELRVVSVDGKDDKLVLGGHRGDPEAQLCDFSNKQFSADGRRLYFMTPGWATSGALHVYDLRTRDERFLLPAQRFSGAELLQERTQGRSGSPLAPLFRVRRQLRLVLAVRFERQERAWPARRARRSRRLAENRPRRMVPLTTSRGACVSSF